MFHSPGATPLLAKIAGIPIEKAEKVKKHEDFRPGASPEERQKYRSWMNKVHVIR